MTTAGSPLSVYLDTSWIASFRWQRERGEVDDNVA